VLYYILGVLKGHRGEIYINEKRKKEKEKGKEKRRKKGGEKN